MFNLTPKELRAISVNRAITAAAGPGLTDGLEAEVFREFAQSIGAQFTPHRFPIPWQILRRDMTVAGVQGSSYLVSTDALDAVQALQPWSVVLQSGATVIPDCRGNITFPRATAAATGYWLADENDPASESQPTLGEVSMTPKTLAAIVTYSHQMAAQSNVDAFLRAHLLQTIGRTLDAAALNGSSISGEPTGIINVPGIHTETGTSLAWSNIQNMLEKVSAAGVQDGALAFVGTPAVRELLAQREVAAGSGLIWNGRSIGGFPANATPDAPAASLYLGAWSELVVALWGAPEISVNPMTYFSTGKLQMRIMLHCDTAVRHDGAFAVASSIT